VRVRARAILLVALVGACAAPRGQGGAEGPEVAAPAPARSAPAPDTGIASAGPTATVRVEAPPSLARRRVEELAARCWLDPELSAGLMLVDRKTGGIVASGAEGVLLRVAFAAAGPLSTDVTLSGPALADAARRARMADALSRVMSGAEPAC